MGTGWWAVVFFAAVAVIAGIWMGNTLRWTRANDNLARHGPKAVGRGTGARRRGAPLVAGIVVTGISVVALVWSILYATAN